jgi:hypothetical protein
MKRSGSDPETMFSYLTVMRSSDRTVSRFERKRLSVNERRTASGGISCVTNSEVSLQLANRVFRESLEITISSCHATFALIRPVNNSES